MSIFASLRQATQGIARSLNKEYGSSKDFLEGVCAAAALVAASDGSVSDEEVVAATEAVAANKTLGSIYRSSEVESMMTRMCGRAKTGSGRMELWRELEDVTAREGTTQMAQDIYLIAFDVASASGDVDPKERAQLDKIATKLGVSAKQLEG